MYRLEDTLYLDVTAPTIKPCLVLEPDSGSTIDFKQIAVGDYCTKTVTVKNVSSNTLSVSNSGCTVCVQYLFNILVVFNTIYFKRNLRIKKCTSATST